MTRSAKAQPDAGDGSPFPSIDRYRITRSIAKGGMGEVFEAIDEELSRRVAVKVVSDELLHEPKNVDRFKLEAKSLASINHPNVVAVYASGHEAGAHYIVMELVEGESLSAILGRGAVPVPTALLWLKAILGGLGAVHRAGLIHRDIKPENLIVRPDDTVKITDFGLVTFDDVSRPKLTKTGLVLGTVDFLAPELVMGARASIRSDLYAVGIVLFELLTGTPAFADPNPLLKLKAIRENELPLPASLNPAIPESLQEVVLRLCRKDANARYASVDEVESDLAARGLWNDLPSPGRAARPALRAPAIAGESKIRERLTGLGFDARETEAILAQAVEIQARQNRKTGRLSSIDAGKLFDLSGEAIELAIRAHKKRKP